MELSEVGSSKDEHLQQTRKQAQRERTSSRQDEWKPADLKKQNHFTQLQIFCRTTLSARGITTVSGRYSSENIER